MPVRNAAITCFDSIPKLRKSTVSFWGTEIIWFHRLLNFIWYTSELKICYINFLSEYRKKSPKGRLRQLQRALAVRVHQELHPRIKRPALPASVIGRHHYKHDKRRRTRQPDPPAQQPCSFQQNCCHHQWDDYENGRKLLRFPRQCKISSLLFRVNGFWWRF